MSTLNELITYSNNIVDGKILAGKKHVWACIRFLSDLKRIGDKDFPYYFCEDSAESSINWCKLYTHSSGILAGKKIDPEITWKFILGNVYGWRNVETKNRRFSNVYWQVARKNGKSQLLSCIASYELSVIGNGIEKMEVYCAASKRDQAKIVFDETKKMISNCELVRDKFKILINKIIHVRTGSVMSILSKDDSKRGDGFNVQCGVVDEYQAHLTDEILNVLESGVVSRAQPLIIIITTAGFNLDSPCYRIEYDLVSKILDPENPIKNENYFGLICELDKNEALDNLYINGRTVKTGELIDDINDISTWFKSNPIACSYPEGIENLKRMYEKAKTSPEKMLNFLTKNLNVWCSFGEAGYIDIVKWKACKQDSFDIKDKVVIIGVDLSSRLDLSSVGIVIPCDDNFILLSHSFMPYDSIDKKEKMDRVPYRIWIEQGWITATPGEVIDYKYIKAYICDIVKKNNWYVEAICIDPWSADQISNDLLSEGYSVVGVRQGIMSLGEPTKLLRELIYSKKICHDDNPVLTWALSNTIVDTPDKNLNFMLNKKKSIKRIDPVSALINAFSVAKNYDGKKLTAMVV